MLCPGNWMEEGVSREKNKEKEGEGSEREARKLEP